MKDERPKFVLIACSADKLFALDTDGQVWQYNPAKDVGTAHPRYSFWGRLTSHRAEDS